MPFVHGFNIFHKIPRYCGKIVKIRVTNSYKVCQEVVEQLVSMVVKRVE